MNARKPQKVWLPYIVVTVGITLSTVFWYILWTNIEAYFEFLHQARDYLPWIALIAGSAISVLLGVIINMAQLARQRAIILNQMNEDLTREIADRINAEETKQKFEQGMLQGQKLQAMGTLAGGIAHDFNNILYAINGYVDMAREDIEKDSVPYRNLGKVLEASHRGQELVSRILSFTRRQHHEFSPINLKSAFESALSLLRPTIPSSVIIDFKTEKNPTILGNQTQVHQVLVNLITNAVDAMDGEGTIHIQLSELAGTDPFVRQFPEARAENYCKIEISDTGHGMDQQTIDRIFEPFYTTKEVGKGTGLGLSIVHTIVKEHQGEITVKSQLGHGTTFMILLPIHSA